jgi:hypothetical protein
MINTEETLIGRFYELATNQIAFMVDEGNWVVSNHVYDDLKAIYFNVNIEGVEEIIKQLPLFYDCRLIPQGFKWEAKQGSGAPFPVEVYSKTKTKSGFLITSYSQPLLMDEIVGPIDGPMFTQAERQLK